MYLGECVSTEPIQNVEHRKSMFDTFCNALKISVDAKAYERASEWGSEGVRGRERKIDRLQYGDDDDDDRKLGTGCANVQITDIYTENDRLGNSIQRWWLLIIRCSRSTEAFQYVRSFGSSYVQIIVPFQSACCWNMCFRYWQRFSVGLVLFYVYFSYATMLSCYLSILCLSFKCFSLSYLS